MKKIIFILLAFCACVYALNEFGLNHRIVFKHDSDTFKEGDIVFQISKSKQSPFIQLATKSPWSHCGIIIHEDDDFYVLEASNVVK